MSNRPPHFLTLNLNTQRLKNVLLCSAHPIIPLKSHIQIDFTCDSRKSLRVLKLKKEQLNRRHSGAASLIDNGVVSYWSWRRRWRRWWHCQPASDDQSILGRRRRRNVVVDFIFCCGRCCCSRCIGLSCFRRSRRFPAGRWFARLSVGLWRRWWSSIGCRWSSTVLGAPSPPASRWRWQFRRPTQPRCRFRQQQQQQQQQTRRRWRRKLSIQQLVEFFGFEQQF